MQTPDQTSSAPEVDEHGYLKAFAGVSFTHDAQRVAVKYDSDTMSSDLDMDLIHKVRLSKPSRYVKGTSDEIVGIDLTDAELGAVAYSSRTLRYCPDHFCRFTVTYVAPNGVFFTVADVLALVQTSFLFAIDPGHPIFEGLLLTVVKHEHKARARMDVTPWETGLTEGQISSLPYFIGVWGS